MTPRHPGSSDAPAHKRASAPKRGASKRLDWLTSFDAPTRLSEGEEQALLAALDDPHDVASGARRRLLLGAVGKSSLPAGDALALLQQASAVFDACGLMVEARQARCESAGHLIDAGQPRAAIRLLDEAAAIPCATSADQTAAESAKRAVALFEIGEWAQALAACDNALQGALSGEVTRATRLQLKAWTAACDVLIGGVLASRGLDSALSDGPVWAAQTASTSSSAGTGSPSLALLLRAVPALQLLAPSDPGLSTLAAVTDALTDQAGATDRCDALARRLLGTPAACPGAWLRLAAAYRLTGRSMPAAVCATEALAAARLSAKLRWQRLALTELALIQHAAGQLTLAAQTWMELRRLASQALASTAVADRAVSTVQMGDAAPGGARHGNAHVRTAMQAIEREPGSAWSVQTLAARCGVSRRTLEQAFRLELGQTVGDVLRLHRIQAALRLLERTDHAIKRVAIDAGFSSASGLCRELRRHTGMSPAQYRQHKRTA